MVQQEELESKRQEVREEILGLREKIPTARILNFLGKRADHRGLAYWLINFVFLHLILLIPWVFIGFVIGENRETLQVWTPIIVALEAGVIGLILADIVLQKILNDTANKIIEKINNAEDLSKFMDWLTRSWSLQEVMPFVLPFCLLWVVLGLVSLSIEIHEFIGFGLSITLILVSLFAGIAFHGTFWISLLAANLRNYQYDINTFTPADSEIINDLPEILTKRGYITAAYFAIATLISGSNLVPQQIRIIFSLPIFLIGWMLIIAQFLVTRSTIEKIVNREKWKTLNKIQARINSMEATGDLSDKETSERLLRLVDIHGRIMASRANTSDWKSISAFISQLMLPLLGLLLGSLDTLMALLP